MNNPETVAAQLRRKHNLNTCPVDVENLARLEGIRVQKLSLDDDLSGMSFIRNELKFIVVNSNHHVNRRRFTTAHELAHHCLHSDYLKDNVHVDKIVLYRDSFSAKGVDSREMQANSFAAELLMPLSEILKWDKVDINDDTAVQSLAKKLKVSVAALTYRLTNIGHTK